MAAAPLNRHLSFILGFPLAETEFEDHRFRLEGPEAPELAALSFNNLFLDDLINVRLGAYELPLGFSPVSRRLSITPYEVYGATAQRLLGLEEASASGIREEGQVFALGRHQLLAEIYGTAYSERLGVADLYVRYHLGAANDANVNADNNSAKSVFGRLAVGWGPHVLGVFALWSPDVLDSSRPAGFPGGSSSVLRVGPDLELRFLDERLNIAIQYLWGRDGDPTGVGTPLTFSGGFMQVDYAIRAGSVGTFVPLLRLDYVAADSFDNTGRAMAAGIEPVRARPRVWAVTGGLQYYPWENVRIMGEVTRRETDDRLSRSVSTVEKDQVRETFISLQVMLGF